MRPVVAGRRLLAEQVVDRLELADVLGPRAGRRATLVVLELRHRQPGAEPPAFAARTLLAPAIAFVGFVARTTPPVAPARAAAGCTVRAGGLEPGAATGGIASITLRRPALGPWRMSRSTALAAMALLPPRPPIRRRQVVVLGSRTRGRRAAFEATVRWTAPIPAIPPRPTVARVGTIAARSALGPLVRDRPASTRAIGRVARRRTRVAFAREALATLRLRPFYRSLPARGAAGELVANRTFEAAAAIVALPAERRLLVAGPVLAALRALRSLALAPFRPWTPRAIATVAAFEPLA